MSARLNQSFQKDNIARQRQPDVNSNNISNPADSKVIVQDNFLKKVYLQGQGHYVKNHGTALKVLLQRMHM